MAEMAGVWRLLRGGAGLLQVCCRFVVGLLRLVAPLLRLVAVCCVRVARLLRSVARRKRLICNDCASEVVENRGFEVWLRVAGEIVEVRGMGRMSLAIAPLGIRMRRMSTASQPHLSPHVCCWGRGLQPHPPHVRGGKFFSCGGRRRIQRGERKIDKRECGIENV